MTSTVAPQRLSMRQIIPPHAPGMRIGLLGGSFNPPHAAHREISLFALKRLKLDRVWWLVSPGNPLKDNGTLRSLADRMHAAEQMAHDPRICVSGMETAFGTRYTADTIAVLRNRCSDLRFVWLMGADNLAQFHRWRNWDAISQTVPIAVVDRATFSYKALAGTAARSLARHRIPDAQAVTLADRRAPAWVFLTGLKLKLSSTALRNPDGSWKT